MSMRWPTALVLVVVAACGQGAPKQEGGSEVGGTAVAAAPQSAATPPAAFAVCASCHAVAPGRSGVGPSLAGVWERQAGSAPGYAYSEALKQSGIVWNAQTLDQWLKGPLQMVPGTKMVIGLPNPEARQAVIAYLETLK